MREAVNNGTAKVLTLELAKQLKGKRIRTIYFGYKGQDGVQEFIVGEFASQFELAQKESHEEYSTRAKYWESYMSERQLDEKKTNIMLLSADGNNYHICCHTKYNNWFDELTFTCSDSDREVYFIEVSNEN